MLSNDIQTLSASSVNTFLRCGKQWEFAYVYAIKRPPSLRMAIGLAAHEAVEVNFRQKLETGIDLPVSDVTDAFSDAFDRIDIEPDKKETPEQGKDSGVSVIERYQGEVAPQIQPVLVEEQVQFKVNGIPFSGYIDVVDQHRRVRDFKTVKRKPSGKDYALNMIGYAIGFRQATGETESGITLDYVVRTKKPYHNPVVSGPISDTTIHQFAAVVKGVAEGIRKGVFIPNGLNSGACGWCGYRDICPAFRETIGDQNASEEDGDS